MLSPNKQKEDQLTYQFSNAICKETYNSLPKIYGNGKTKKPKRPKNATSLNVVKHQCSITQQHDQTIKKPMKFHLSRINVLSAPRYYQYSCHKRNCSCGMHDPNQKLSPYKKNLTKRLKPIATSMQTKPDDLQSDYKVKTRTQNSPEKIGSGLMGLLKTHKNQPLPASRDHYQHRDSAAYAISQVQLFTETDRLQRMRTEEISYIRYLDSDDENVTDRHEHRHKGKTVQIQTYPHQYLDNAHHSQVNIINNNVQIQVNFQDAIEEHTQQSKQYEENYNPTPSSIKPGSNLLTKTLRNRKNQEKMKKMTNYRRKKFQISDEDDSERPKIKGFKTARSQECDQVPENEEEVREKNKPEQNTNQNSRIASSLSVRSIVARGLGESRTKFKQLAEKYQKQQSLKGSKVKSINEDGSFNIPKRHEYGEYLKSYKTLDKKTFNINKLVKSPLFKIVEEDDGVYFGELENECKQGNAINVSKKQIFEGLYHENQKIKGSERNVDGVYKGYFVNGKREGYGTFQWNNGEKFEGNWKNGVKEGFGIWRSPKGDSYEGEWHNNRQQGEGTFKHKNSTYTGEFLNFLKHGYGKQSFVNGDKYEGEYKYGKPDGTGIYTWHNGSVYEGEFVEGLRCGYGKWTQRELTISNKRIQIGSYQGQFKDDCKNGEGKQTDAKTGEYFIGQFSLGQKISGTLYNSKGKIIQIFQDED